MIEDVVLRADDVDVQSDAIFLLAAIISFNTAVHNKVLVMNELLKRLVELSTYVDCSYC